MDKDILRWDNQHSAQHHLKAYGGIGTLNDLRIGGTTPEKQWRGAVFELTKKVAWAYASQHESGAKADLVKIIDEFFDLFTAVRCGSCGHYAARGIDVESNAINNVLRRVFAELVVKKDLQSILDFEQFAPAIESTKAKIIASKHDQNFKVYTEKTDWFRKCPICESTDMTRHTFVD